MNRKLAIVFALVVAGESAWLFWRARKLDSVRATNVALRQQENTPLIAPVDPAVERTNRAITRPPEQRAELLRLRGQVAQLRHEVQAASTKVPDDAPGKSSWPAAQDAHRTYRELYGPEFFTTLSKIRNVLFVAAEHDKTIPATLTPEMIGEVGEEAARLAERLEFLPGETITAENDCCIFIAREREARQTPEGDWLRLYLLANGSTTIAHQSGNPDWEKWERREKGAMRESLRRRMTPP